MEKQIVIGLTGSMGSGCTLIAEYLETKGFIKYCLSDKIKEETRRNYKNPTILDYQDMGNKLRQTKGLDFLVRNIIESETHDKICQNNKIVFDSIRNCGEISYLRKNFSNFFLIGVYASFEERKNRIIQDRFNGNLKLFEKADQRDKEEIWEYGQQVRACMELADIILINEQNFSQSKKHKNTLHSKIKEFLNLIENPGSRTPSINEYFMNEAYSVSYQSSCLKRQVGAILCNQFTNEIISFGYNRTPNQRIEECKEKYGYCYRDRKREEKFKELNNCLICEQPISMNLQCECNYDLNEQFKYLIKMLDFCRALHAEEIVITNALRKN
ncbi:MAG: hypothetical protein ACTSRL_22300, partial [Candidatus Helarchaeota archaeon]